MTTANELLLLLLLLLLAASMAGAFARLLRLPAVPMQVLFGVLLAHGPSAVVDARASALLQPAASVALCVVALVLGLRMAAPGRAFLPARPAVLRHMLAEIALVPGLVWLALVLGAGVPAQVALVVGLMALGSVDVVVEALARRVGGVRPAHAAFHSPVQAVAEALAAVARADLAASLALAMAAVFALRLRFDPPGIVHGIELPLAACSLALGISLGCSAPGLVARLAAPAARASGFALAVCGTLAGATILPALLPRALFIASLAVLARLLGKWVAAAWSLRQSAAGDGSHFDEGTPDGRPRDDGRRDDMGRDRGVPDAKTRSAYADGSRLKPGGGARPASAPLHVGLALAPGGLVGVALILSVRHEPSLAGFADMFLAVGVWIATLNASFGPLLARAALRAAFGATISPAEPPAAPRDTPPAR